MAGPGPEIHVEMLFIFIQIDTMEYVQYRPICEFNLQNVIETEACGTSVAERLQLLRQNIFKEWYGLKTL
jgi:hypothetical protein